MTATDITINTTSTCPDCSQLKRWCDDNGILYVEANLEDDLDKLQGFKSANIQRLPIVEKSGQVHSGLKGAKEFILK